MQNPIVKILIIVFAGLGVLVFSVFASRMIVKSMFFSPKTEEAEETVEHHSLGEIYTIQDLVINPAQSGGRRHLLVSLGLEYQVHAEGEGGGHEGGEEGDAAPAGLGAELQRLEPVLRDNLITLLAGQDITILSDIKYREKIRESLLKAINYYLTDQKVDRLYFVKYVFQ